MAAFIEIEDASTPGGRIICGSLATLGRDISSTLQLNDPMVSRMHALIRYVGNDSYYLLDSGSRNGSYVNNRRVSTPTLLKTGDKVTLGNTKITFTQETGDGPVVPNQTQVSLGETISHQRLEIQPITILVADIIGYTSMSEDIPIHTLSKMMTHWFSSLQEVIELHNGRVDKFIGDSVMALWFHDQEPDPKLIHSCLRAAVAINDVTSQLHEQFEEIPDPVEIAVGINTGMAAVGIGSDNTAMGDAVNIAFRLEAACRPKDANLLVSRSTYTNLPEHLWQGREQEIKVKGKNHPTQCCPFSFDDLETYLHESRAEAV